MERQTITSINLGTANKYIEKQDFTGELELKLDKSSSFNKREIVFKECIFREGFYFNINLRLATISNIQVSFQDCIIEKCEKGNTIHSDNVAKLDLIFNSCFIDDLEFDKSSFRTISFSRCLFYSSLLIKDTSAAVISLRNCLGRGMFLRNKKAKISINYADDNLYIERTILKNVRDQIKKEFKIKSIFSFKTRFDIDGANGLICNFKKAEKHGIELLKPKNKKREFKYYLTTKDANSLDISLSINAGADYLKNIEIENGLFNSLSISGESEAEIDIRHSKANSIFIDNLNSPKFRLYDFQSRLEKSKFEIKNSDFSNVWFDKVKLNSFSIVSIYRTTLEKTKFSATDFPNKIEALKNIHYPDRKESEYFKNQYENYKQLKIALLNQNNQIQALQMHSKMYGSIRRSKELSRQDRFILFLNDLSNQHGTSILNPFLCFLVALLILYIIYNMLLPNAPYEIGWISLDNFLETLMDMKKFIYENWKNVFTLANPTHRVSQLIENNSGKEISWGNYLISFLSRIIIGWTIYQFITAFRKFGKTI